MTLSGRTRTLAAVGAALALMLTAPAYAGGTTSSQRLAASPTVGECRSLTPDQAGSESDPSAPIDCATAHNSRVIAVPSLPKGITYADLDTKAAVDRTAAKLCYPAFRAAVGQNDRVRSRTAYAYLFFVPTAQERTDGARWLRCDLALQHGAKLGNLPTDRVPALTEQHRPDQRQALPGRLAPPGDDLRRDPRLPRDRLLHRRREAVPGSPADRPDRS